MKRLFLQRCLTLLVAQFFLTTVHALKVGETTSLSIGSDGVNHLGVYPAWIISNPDVVELVNDGQTYILIKGIAEGTCAISCEYWDEEYDKDRNRYYLGDKHTRSWTISVSGSVDSGLGTGAGDEGGNTQVDIGRFKILGNGSETVVVGQRFGLHAYGSNSLTFDPSKVTWQSMNSSVVEFIEAKVVRDIYPYGYFRAKSIGQTTVTASCSGNTASCTVIVQKAPEPLTSISISDVQIEKGSYFVLKPTKTPIDGIDELKWSSNNVDIVEVDNRGVVYGKDQGSAEITVSSIDNPQVTATCSVTVIAHQLLLTTSNMQDTISLGQAISLSCDKEHAEIYYTINGDTPNIHSNKYLEPIYFTHSATLRAKAILNGYEESDILCKNIIVESIDTTLSYPVNGAEIANQHIIPYLEFDSPITEGLNYSAITLGVPGEAIIDRNRLYFVPEADLPYNTYQLEIPRAAIKTKNGDVNPKIILSFTISNPAERVVAIDSYKNVLRIIKNDSTLWEINGTKSRKIMDNVKVVSGNHAIDHNGVLWGWGNNQYGQVGDGTTVNRDNPVWIKDSIKLISHSRDEFESYSGEHCLAIDNNDNLWVWGCNDHNQLGNGSTTNQLSPVKILTDIISVSTSGNASLAVDRNGKLYAWGQYSVYYNYNWIFIQKSSPTSFYTNVNKAIIVSSRGMPYGALVSNNGDLYTWGYEYCNILGDGPKSVNGSQNRYYSRYPYKIISGMKDVSMSHLGVALAIDADCHLWGWGSCNTSFGSKGYAPALCDFPDSVIQIANAQFILDSKGNVWKIGDSFETTKNIFPRKFDLIVKHSTATPMVPISEVSIASSITLTEKEKKVILPICQSDNADYNYCKWFSSDSSVVSISQRGVICAKKPGEATITLRIQSTDSNIFERNCFVVVEEKKNVILQNGDVFSDYVYIDNSQIDALFSIVSSEDQTICVGDGKGACIEVSTNGGIVISNEITGSDTKNYHVSSIADYAFACCDKITSVTIPQSVKEIGLEAFSGCQSISSFVIPENVSSIGERAFVGCDNLGIVVSEASHPSSFNNNVFPNEVYNNAILRVPLGSISKYKNTDGWKNFKNISDGFDDGDTFTAPIPFNEDSIIIATFIFVDREKNLIGLGDSINCALSSRYYSGTISLPYKIKGPDNVYYDLIKVSRNAFKGCSHLRNIFINDSIKIIENGAFSGCSSLTSYVIPPNMKIISDSLFYDCNELQTVTIHSHIESIGKYAFAECPQLFFVNVGPHDPISIAENCFTNRSNAILCVPKGCKSAYESADYWNEFSKIIEPKLNDNELFTASIMVCNEAIDAIFKVKNADNDYVYIGNGESTSIVDWTDGNVVIPSSVTGSDGETYQVTGISDFAFFGCSFLNSITIPEGINIIGNTVFYGCSGLTTLTIPESVTTIGEEAFLYCDNLSEITIPINVTSIGKDAFADCNNLTSVTVEWAEPIAIDEECFTNAANATLYVPAGTKAMYKAATGWKDFGRIVDPTEDTDIAELDDAIYIEPMTGCAGATVNLQIKLKNAQAATSYGFELVLPEGMSIDVTNDGSFDEEIRLSSRHSNHTLTTNKQADGSYKVAVASLSSKSLADNDGTVLNIKSHIADDMALGDYPIWVQKPLIVYSDGTKPTVQDVRTRITIEDYTFGDVDGDYVVDLADAVLVINYYVGKSVSKFNALAADVDGDGIIDLADAVRIINYYVGKIVHLSPKRITKELDPQ